MATHRVRVVYRKLSSHLTVTGGVPTSIQISDSYGTTTIDFAVVTPILSVLTLATVLRYTFLRTDLSISENIHY
jgi:hypothetical protein